MEGETAVGGETAVRGATAVGLATSGHYLRPSGLRQCSWQTAVENARVRQVD